MSQIQIEIDPRSAAALVDDMKSITRSVRASLLKGLYRDAKRYINRFRASLPGKFKIQKSNLGRAFRLYAKQTPTGPEIGIFTRWKAARLYETGGTITGQGAMAVPINPKAFTADGRVKKKWRDPKNFPDLFQITTKSGAVLLVQGKKQVTTSGAARRSGVQPGNFRAFAPMFVMIRSTRRSPKLRFFSDFQAYMASGFPKLDQAVSDAVNQTPRSGARA